MDPEAQLFPNLPVAGTASTACVAQGQYTESVCVHACVRVCVRPCVRACQPKITESYCLTNRKDRQKCAALTSHRYMYKYL